MPRQAALSLKRNPTGRNFPIYPIRSLTPRSPFFSKTGNALALLNFPKETLFHRARWFSTAKAEPTKSS
jgi:hypothetical protein